MKTLTHLFSSTLATGIDDAATSITLVDASSLNLGAGENYRAVLQKPATSTPGQEVYPILEVITIIDVTGNVLTVERGKEGTTATDFVVGNFCEISFDADGLNALLQRSEVLNEDDFASGSTTLPPSQQSVAAYIANLKATTAEAEAGIDDAKYMTPLKSTEQVTARIATQAEAETGTDNSKLMTTLQVKNVGIANYAESLVDTYQVLSGYTAVPMDDTIPQITEGAEVTSVAFTPKYDNSLILVEYETFNGCSTNAIIAASLYIDGGVDAVDTSFSSYTYTYWAYNHPVRGTYRATGQAGVEQTFQLRIGANTGTAILLNGNASLSSRIYGGAVKSGIRITEHRM